MEVMTESKTILTEKDRQAVRKTILHFYSYMSNLRPSMPEEMRRDFKILEGCYKKLDGENFLQKVDFLQRTSLINDHEGLFYERDYPRLDNIEKYCANVKPVTKESEVS